MRNKIDLLLIIAVIAIVIGCKFSDGKKEGANKLVLKPEIADIIKNYIKTHSQYNTFILEVNPIIPFSYDNQQWNQYGFLLGPGYQELIKDKNLYIDIDQRRIYISTGLTTILSEDKETSWDNKVVSDSVTIGNEIYRNRDVCFIVNGIFFYKNDKDSFIVSSRADTIFFPKKLKPLLKFKQL